MSLLTRRLSIASLALLIITMVGGCGLGAPDVPKLTTVTLPDGTQIQATLGSGVISLADSKWKVFQAVTGGQTFRC